MSVVSFEGQVEIPMHLRTLGQFRQWTLSDRFPERGRIDFVAGRIEVDMSPEDLFTHGTLKVEIVGVLHECIKAGLSGHLFVDRARVSNADADLSAEPDVVFVSRESLANGAVRLTPKASGEPGRYVELDGAPDLVVEIVSDTSFYKDTQRLPGLYFSAGVGEYWLADARGETLAFHVYQRGSSGYEAVHADADGFQVSQVLGRRVRLERYQDDQGLWCFNLVAQPA